MSDRKSLWTYLLGTVFMFFGIAILLDNLQVIYFKEIWKLYWPILIILIGIIMVIRKTSGAIPDKETNNTVESEIKVDFEVKKDEEPAFSATSSSGEFNQSNIFGNINFHSQSKEYSGGSISNVFGDMYIDLREIDFQDGKKELNINGVFGSIRIFLPADIPVKFSGSTIAGSVKFLSEKKDGLMVNLLSAMPEYGTATKKLFIKTSLVFGDISIE